MGTPPTLFLIEQRFIPQFQDFLHSQSFYVLFWRTLYYIAVSTPWGHVPRRSGGHTSLQKKHGVFLLYSDYLFNYFLPEIPLWFGGVEITSQKSWEGMSPLPTEFKGEFQSPPKIVFCREKTDLQTEITSTYWEQAIRVWNSEKRGSRPARSTPLQRENGVRFENRLSNLRINQRKIGG